MTQVQFDDENTLQTYTAKVEAEKGEPGIVGWLMRHNIVRSRLQANILLLVMAAVFFAAAVIVALRLFK